MPQWGSAVLPGAGSVAYDAAVIALSPTAYWQLADAIASSTAADSSGNSRTGTATSVTFGAASPIPPDKGASFNGSTSQVTQAYNIPAGNFSVIAWFNATSNGSPITISASDDPTATPFKGYRIYQNGTGAHIECMMGNGTTWGEAQTPTPALGSWHMVAMTFDGTTIRAYLDGVLTGSTVFGPSTTGTHGASIGVRPDTSTNFFLGGIAQVALFTTALSLAQIANLYGLGAGIPVSAVVQQAVLSASQR